MERNHLLIAATAIALLALLEMLHRVDAAERRLCSLGGELYALRRELAIARANTRQQATARHKMQRRPPQRLTRAPRGS